MVRFYQLLFTLLFATLSTLGQPKSAISAFQIAQKAFRSGNETKGWKYLEKSMKKGKEYIISPIYMRVI